MVKTEQVPDRLFGECETAGAIIHDLTISLRREAGAARREGTAIVNR